MAAAQRLSRERTIIWVLAAALLIAVGLLLATLAKPAPASPTAESTATPSATASPQAVPDLSRRTEGDPAAMGAVDAPVVLVEYADYRCPYCGVYARDVLPALVSDYVDEGLLRIEWRDLPLFGEESVNAAIATRAAGEQGKFWEYSRIIYSYSESGHQPLPVSRLLEIAAEAGVADMDAFQAALSDPDIAAAVSADAKEAQSLGFSGTPTFLIGQYKVVGAQPLDVFRQAIDAELARLGS